MQITVKDMRLNDLTLLKSITVIIWSITCRDMKKPEGNIWVLIQGMFNDWVLQEKKSIILLKTLAFHVDYTILFLFCQELDVYPFSLR